MAGLLPYLDEQGRQIVTQSMLKTFTQCPRWAKYKYVDRLTPRREGAAPKLGTWMHRLLEVHYQGKDWRTTHEELSKQFRAMFEEEQAHYGDMPTMARMLMEAYVWHYEHDHWKVLETEFTAETEFPDGKVYRMRADMLVEDQFGLWLVDHKWPRSLPDGTFRLLDRQSALYIWALRRLGYDIQGFVFNYGRRKVPSVPKITAGGRVSTRRLDTEYVALVAALRKYKAQGHHLPASLIALAKQLKTHQYQDGEPQRSRFFYRHVVEKSDAMVKQVAGESYHTAKRMERYPFHRPEIVERVVGRHCTYLCPFTDLCTTELIGGNVTAVMRGYRTKDPMAYYTDDREVTPE
jgi:hypothetical protein